MTMNPWIAEDLVKARRRDIERYRQPLPSMAGEHRQAVRPAAARWAGRLLIRLGARLAGMKATIATGQRLTDLRRATRA